MQLCATALGSVGTACAPLRAKPVQARRKCLVIPVSAHLDKQASIRRRDALAATVSGAAWLLLGAPLPAGAAYGEAANVFGGKPTNATGFIPYEGNGFRMLLPSRWNPSKLYDDSGELRWSDNMNAEANNVTVIKRQVSAKRITDLGDPMEFLDTMSKDLLKDAVWSDGTREGGFKPGQVAAASILEAKTETDRSGNTYYKYHLLTRTADGTEGGHHLLMAAAVSNGDLYVMRASVGDKRWIRGAQKFAKGLYDSFTVV